MTRKIPFVNDPLDQGRLSQSMQISEKIRVLFDRGGSSNIRPQSTLRLEWLRPSSQPLRGDMNQEALDTLKASIQEQGVVEPLVVRLQSDHYEIICGHRRFRAATELGLDEVPVVVRELDDQQAFVLSLHENIHRDDLSPLEEAKAYQKMLDDGVVSSRRQLAKILGISHTRVNQKIGLLGVPEEIQGMMDSPHSSKPEADPEPKTEGGNPVSTLSEEENGNPVSTPQSPRNVGLTERHIRAIRRIASPEEQVRVARDVISQNLTVAETENVVSGELRSPRNRSRPVIPKRANWVQLGLGRYKEFDDRLLIEIRSVDRGEQLSELKSILKTLQKSR